MRVDVVPVVPDELMDRAWDFYRETFDELRYLAVNRHLLHRDEFDDLMTDKRAVKYLSLDAAGDVVGLAAMTTELEAVSLISPDYFRHHWPDLYDQGRIFYVMFVGAAPGARGTGVFVSLLREMVQPILAVDGKVVVDICTYNEERHRLPRMIGVILGRVGRRTEPRRLDSQSFWLYEFPQA